MEEYIDIQGASRLLGEAPGKVYYYADKGTIRIEPGREERRTRRYSVADILALKERIQARHTRAIERKPKPDKPLIDWLYAADVPAGLRLSQQVYSEEIDLAEAAIYQAWRKHNPYLTMAAFSPDRSENYASIQVVPLRNEQVILDVLRNRREESSISPDEIESYDRPGGYTLLVTSATCLPDRPHLLYSVLHKYMEYWLDMYPERWIKRVYAQATESGMRLIQHMFFAPRPDLSYNAFMLDLAWPPAAKMIKTFKARMEEKSPLPDDLSWPPILHQEARPTPQPVKHTRPERTSLWSQERITASSYAPSTPNLQELPDDLVPFADFFKQHGIPESTARRGIGKTFSIAPGGPWIIGGFQVKQVLDQQGQHEFYEAFHDKASFTPCAKCPHGVNRSPAPEVSASDAQAQEDA